MPDRNIWLFTAAALVVVMLFFNRKVRLWAVLKEQIKVFKNAKKQRISLWDCLCFLVFPWVFSYICVYQLLTTVFSIVFTVLFGFAAVMVIKIDSTHKTEKQVAEETFVSIVSANLMSLIAAILSIVLTQTKSEIIVKISSVVLLGSSLIIILLLLLITKRTFFLYVDNKD